MISYARPALSTIFILLAASGAAAEQTFQVAAKGGATIERAEDGLEGTVPAVGFTAATNFSPAWRGEIEFWLPGHLELGHGRRHRDVLLGASVIRLFGTDGVRPFALAGLTLTRTEDDLTYCFADLPRPGGGGVERTLVGCDTPGVNSTEPFSRAGTGIALTTGGGLEIPIGRRLNLVADVRLLITPGALLVRPAVGMGIGF